MDKNQNEADNSIKKFISYSDSPAIRQGMTTIESLSKEDIANFDEPYEYQKDLTAELDKLNADFNQDVINEIVLWKVNRYTKVSDEALSLLNKISRNETVIDIDLTKEILRDLLTTKGIGIAMASTILRFRNPTIYQIIDQRVYRFTHPDGDELKQPKDVEETISLYLDYLERLKAACLKHEIPFEESDRTLYLMDIKFNKKYKLQ